jgi:hypothetical protein
MYLLVNVRTMRVLHRYENNVTLAHMAHIEGVGCPCSIFEETNLAAYAGFSQPQLEAMYEHLTNGETHVGSKSKLAADIAVLANIVVPSKIDAFEAYLQAKAVPFEDVEEYHYAFGSNKPGQGEGEYGENHGRADLSYAQSLTPALPITSPPAPATPTPWASAPSATPPAYAPPWL